MFDDDRPLVFGRLSGRPRHPFVACSLVCLAFIFIRALCFEVIPHFSTSPRNKCRIKQHKKRAATAIYSRSGRALNWWHRWSLREGSRKKTKKKMGPATIQQHHQRVCCVCVCVLCCAVRRLKVVKRPALFSSKEVGCFAAQKESPSQSGRWIGSVNISCGAESDHFKSFIVVLDCSRRAGMLNLLPSG